MKQDRALWVLLTGWMLFSIASLWLRPLWPVDETRYARVAWEMWLRGDFLVPYINGEPYSHKPPLLFWLIHAGWYVFGVDDIWPRVLEVLIGGAQLVLVSMLARRLFPSRPWMTKAAPWMR